MIIDKLRGPVNLRPDIASPPEYDGPRMKNKTQNVLVKLTVEGVAIEGAVELPAGPSPRRTLLPALQRLTDAIVGIAHERAAGAGEHVSCRKGCDACCRQMVPLAPAEVFALASYLDGLMPSTVAPVLQRFDQAVETLQAKGLLDALRMRHQLPPPEMQALDRAYFAARIACPFLVDRACSIHALRPLVCREYAVTSDAQFCAHPEADKVRQVVLGARVSQALLKGERGAGWVPLVLAREFAAQHHETLADRPAEALRGILKRL
jgi:Fe-S-cluster containining protein